MTVRSDLSAPWQPPPAAPPPDPKIAPASALPPDGIPGFTLGKTLGKGGMGLVMAGTRTSDGRAVAIKLLRGDVVGDKEFRERFHREVEVMREVQHRNVVSIVDSGETGGWLWLALELMPDGDLERYLRPRGQLFEKDALSFSIKIGRGLAAIHAAGLLHRDIKPQNIFLHHKAADGGDVKVGDLGMARHSSGDDRMTMTGTACGTPAYMAPEQIRGLADLDARVDVYALGVLLYTLLAGKEPFSGDTIYTVTHAVLNDPVPDLRRSNPNVSPAVVAIINRAMAKDRAQRYASMDELLRDLEAVASGARPVHTGVMAAPAPAVQRAGPTPRTVPAAGSLGGGMVDAGGGSLPGLGLLVRVILIVAVIAVPLTLLPKLLEARGEGKSTVDDGRPRVAPGRDTLNHFIVIRAAGADFPLRWCPPGSFTMGSTAKEDGHVPWERAHRVRLSHGCWMLEHEVSQAQYQAVMGTNPSQHADPGLPVDSVSFAEAEAFIAKLNQMVPGLGARLPTEAEWEYACRAGRSDAFSVEASREMLLTQADVLAAWDKQPAEQPVNYDAVVSALRWSETTANAPGPRPVGQGQANGWGLTDLHGNVQEWCQDRWDYRSPYADGDATDPRAGEAPLAVVRGGSWAHPASRARSASRDALDPDVAWPWLGFRFVIPAGDKPEPLPTGE